MSDLVNRWINDLYTSEGKAKPLGNSTRIPNFGRTVASSLNRLSREIEVPETKDTKEEVNVLRNAETPTKTPGSAAARPVSWAAGTQPGTKTANSKAGILSTCWRIYKKEK